MTDQQSYKLSLAASHHVESFNFISQEGLTKIQQYMAPMELHVKDIQTQPSSNTTNNNKPINLPFTHMKLSFQSLHIGKPYRTQQPLALVQQIFPQQCRMAGKTYGASLMCQIQRQIDGAVDKFSVSLGQIPIMARSTHCHLYGLDEQQLIKLNEDPNQYGGYFIVNGNQKVIRMLIAQKRNYPVAFVRTSYSNRGAGYTPYACQMRCVRDDLYTKSFTLHYIADGSVNLRILYKKQEFLIPIIVILKAIGEFSDRQIYTRLMKGKREDSDRSDKVQVLIKTARSLCLYRQSHFLEYLGKNFRLLLGISTIYTDRQAGQIFLAENIMPHLSTSKQKFDTLCLMIDKLYALVNEEIMPENLDAMSVHEVLLPGHLYLMILREKLQECLAYVRAKMIKDAAGVTSLKLRDMDYLKKAFEGSTIGKQLEFFLATGNIKSRTGLDLMQDKGFVIIADKLNNMRFLSHFRSIHRGAYFAEMKTTTVRKLLPECWGFLCPVHTPDGAPCGLLNHITISCCPLTKEAFNPSKYRSSVLSICQQNGMISCENFNEANDTKCYPVMVNGYHAGYIEDDNAQEFTESLRLLKVRGERMPPETQIAFLKKGKYKNTAYPMIFITTSSARFLRPVKYLPLNKTQWITPLEQLYMDIDLPTALHSQISTGNVLSILPQHIPFMNYNQSPRNMYQCQMAKQTMGTSVLNWDYRFDNKMYRILHSQLPLVKTKYYEDFKFDDYNSGTNAVVAVISYTGYDMEDAMIINKSSYERGFGHGCVYKTVEYLLNKDQGKKPAKFLLFKNAPKEEKKKFNLPMGIQSDGLAKIGTKLKKFSPILVVYDDTNKKFKTYFNKETEPCSIDNIIITGTTADKKNQQKILVKLRFDRRPVIGDKFSSRHGQKGVLSMLWPQIDMPFTQTGMTPDIIINPNAFPSRMTIGMLIESMVAKSAALQGQQVKYEPFESYENDDVIQYFGKKLLNSGFNYYGNQTMYSGVYGTQLKVDIFIGLVYYQRLRHMVHDKSQARSTGPVDILTQQPLKGRKKGGGIRMGEMERDAMLAHGLSHIINERLFKSSDYSQGYVCNKCGSMLSCYKKLEKISGESIQQVHKESAVCRSCKSEDCSLVGIPYVVKYLINQLAAMNIKIKFRLRE